MTSGLGYSGDVGGEILLQLQYGGDGGIFQLVRDRRLLGLDELMPSCCVCRLSTINKKCFSSLNSYPISILFGLFEQSLCLCIKLPHGFEKF